MRKITSILIIIFICFISSCQKEISYSDLSQQPAPDIDPLSNTLSGGFSARIDGKRVDFTVISATLRRYTITNEKRLDMTGISIDNTKKITITIGEKNSVGGALTTKKYILNPFPTDDPLTPNIDESMYIQGYTIYGTVSGVYWLFDIYNESGIFTVVSCDASTTLLSGFFETTLIDQANNSRIIKITDGVAKNIKYKIIN